jgi:hypothetical protein
VVRLTLDAHRLAEMDRQAEREAKARARRERLARLRAMHLDFERLRAFVHQYDGTGREELVTDGFLEPAAPAKGTSLITDDHRTAAGIALLQHAKDMLFGCLFGDESTETYLDRVQSELLTFALPRFKATALDFMRASTELSPLPAPGRIRRACHPTSGRTTSCSRCSSARCPTSRLDIRSSARCA